MTAQFSAGSKNNWYFSKIGVVLNIPDSSNGKKEKNFKSLFYKINITRKRKLKRLDLGRNQRTN